ncbi:hypothetical protein DPMN_104476 [Dreissena polymorpha]|uniref:Uncharacterized protein n=1 Tax=Dreissena polymorpha TaxID=45954 RepID=A0A9D4K1Q0_DREPO|nr:hypothetical protein DPMN_104476 [Dreissena polymorpha]
MVLNRKHGDEFYYLDWMYIFYYRCKRNVFRLTRPYRPDDIYGPDATVRTKTRPYRPRPDHPDQDHTDQDETIRTKNIRTKNRPYGPRPDCTEKDHTDQDQTIIIKIGVNVQDILNKTKQCGPEKTPEQDGPGETTRARHDFTDQYQAIRTKTIRTNTRPYTLCHTGLTDLCECALSIVGNGLFSIMALVVVFVIGSNDIGTKTPTKLRTKNRPNGHMNTKYGPRPDHTDQTIQTKIRPSGPTPANNDQYQTIQILRARPDHPDQDKTIRSNTS